MKWEKLIGVYQLNLIPEREKKCVLIKTPSINKKYVDRVHAWGR